MEPELQEVITGLNRPGYAFQFDDWARFTLANLERLTQRFPNFWAGKAVWETGVGVGTNLAGLLHLCRINSQPTPERLVYSDFDLRMTTIAHWNLVDLRKKWQLMVGLQPVSGSVDGLTPANGGSTPRLVDVILGCLPQVPMPEDLILSEADNYSHYYTGHTENKWHQWGLGLNADVLAEGREVLPRHGHIILILAGRPGWETLREMFTSSGFQIDRDMSHKTVVQQCPQTTLRSIIQLEKGCPGCFEFYRDQTCQHSIGAQEAEELRLAEVKIYHYLHAIVARKE